MDGLGACEACGGVAWTALPAIAPCFFGDGRVVEGPLAAWHCDACGLRRGRVEADLEGQVFASYDLSALEGTGPSRRARGARMAAWVLEAAALPEGGRLADVGCGDGSLLLGIASIRPDIVSVGWEPSAPAVEQARAAGVDARRTGPGEVPPGGADLDAVVSVNVLEHVPDPVGFLRALTAMLCPGGLLVLIVPDGDAPGPDMLVADHRRSLTASALHHLAGRAGLRVVAGPDPSPGLGGFVRVVLAAGTGSEVVPRLSVGLDRRRAAYLTAWAELDTRLGVRLPQDGTIALFGGGEAALMLRMFAPRVFARATEVLQDEPAVDSLLGLSCTPLGSRCPGSATLVLALQPHLHMRLAERLERSGWSVVAWADLLAPEGANQSAGGAA